MPNRSSMIGALRGKLSIMGRKFVGVSVVTSAKWWQSQFRGIIGFHAGFIGCGQLIMDKLAPISNAGVRKVMHWDRRYNVGAELLRVKSSLNLCVQNYFCKRLVSYVGHCFRHTDQPIAKLLSLDFPSRLTNLRLQRQRGVPSNLALRQHTVLELLGLQLGELVTGRLDSRGHSGFVFRWGAGWFWEIRDGGVGWPFENITNPLLTSV